MIASEPKPGEYVSQGLRLRYVEWGRPSAPPLVLVHGGRDHGRSWDAVAAALKDDWRVIAPDLRGHGLSEASADRSYSMSRYVYDLAALVRALGLHDPCIVGHSLGGNIAVRYAGIYPEIPRRLVCIEGLGPAPKLLAQRDAHSLAARTRDWIEEQHALPERRRRRFHSVDEAVARLMSANPRLSSELARHLTLHGLKQDEDGGFGWRYDIAVRSLPPADFTGDQLRELWSRITCPTLLVYGAESWASNPAQDGRAAHFPDARVRSLAGAGHWVQHDRPEEFIGLLKEFLA